MALRVASRGDSPCSMCCSTASTTTIASSTTSPMARTRPNSDRVLIEKPSKGKTAKVPTSETGTARRGIRVARQFCRKINTTRITRIERLDERLDDLFDAFRSRQESCRARWCNRGPQETWFSIRPSTASRGSSCRWRWSRKLVDGDDRGRSAVQPSDLVVALRAELDPSHILHPHDRTVRDWRARPRRQIPPRSRDGPAPEPYR